MTALSLVRGSRASGLARAREARHTPSFIATPAVIEQIQREVAFAAETGRHLRVAGRGHTRAPLSRCDDGLLQLSRFTGIEDIDAVSGVVWVRSGTRLSMLARELARYGLALPTLGWPGNETVGGAVSLGTYGLGCSDNALEAPVVGLRMVGADAATFTIGAQDPRFALARVGLGVLGVLSHVGLRCVPITGLQARVTRGALETTLSRVEAMRAHDYVEWLWQPQNGSVSLRHIDRAPRRPPGSVSRQMSRLPEPLRGKAEELLQRVQTPLTERRARRGPFATGGNRFVDGAEAWRLFAPSALDDTGFALPLERLPETVHKLGTLLRAIGPRREVTVRVRYARADAAALSPAHGAETALIDLRGLPDDSPRDDLEAAAEIFERADARPLWSTPYEHHASDLARLYPDWGAFCLLRAQLDPQGLFLNDYLDGLFGAGSRIDDAAS